MTLRFAVYLFLIFSSIPYGFFHWKKLRRPFKTLVCMLLLIFISETLTRVTNHYLKSSRPLYHVLVAFELILYPAIYFQSFPKKNKMLRSIILGISALAFAFSVLWSVNSNIINTFPSGSIMLLSLVVITCSLFAFNFMLRQTHIALKENSLFWFNLGNLVFYTVTFVVFGLANPLAARYGGLPPWCADIVYLCNLTLYACYFLAIHKEVKSHGSHARA
jgi:hypothetical protein